MSKEPLSYYIHGPHGKIELNKLEDENKNEITNNITRKTRREHYYGNMQNR
jgi:hypothetical protein